MVRGGIGMMRIHETDVIEEKFVAAGAPSWPPS